MALVLSIPIWAGEKTVTISRNEGIYDDGTGVYYCSKGGITMTFSSGLNNVNYLVEHQQVVFDIFSTNYVIKKIKFNCLDNTMEGNMDCFYWGPSTISELGAMATYVPTGSYTWSGYVGTWVGGSTPSKYVKFVTRGKPVRFGSVEITYEKDLGDIFDLVTSMNEIAVGQKYVIVSQRASKAMSTQTVDGLPENNISKTTLGSTTVSFVDDTKQKVIVNEDVMILSLESNPSTVSNTMRPYLFKYGNQYLRRNSATSGSDTSATNYTYGHNLSLASYETATDKMYFPFNISLGTNSNAMMSFIQRGATQESESTSGTYAIRYHNGRDFFRVLNWSTTYNTYAANQRVYLYRPAQNYVITTQCLPNDNSGYITLGNGVLELNGQQTSQQYQNVSFFVGPTEGWGVDTVTVTDLNSRAVTTLQPTNTSDFGNDYSFEMPANNVHITAIFLQPFNIDTICSPANGGQFNFINGFTNFSGQYYSNKGKTVSFKPTAADGYIFNSVTITDNGVTTTLTPDADGVYSFEMPGNAVTLTANFEEANDLYLLGTANGRTNWIPSGPKFTFDGQKYYIDVYFKGGNDDPNTDPAYGYFSLTKKIDEGGVWNNIAGFRLAAENNNTRVEDGYTGVLLYDDRPNNAFKIKPGVYRIEVNSEMTEMSIIEYPLTVTFTPASGTVVDAGDVVRFTSNLNDLVHGINSQEVQATYNSYDNWGVTTSDDTHTITHDGITTVTGQSKIGYITATGTADYEIVGDLYLLGTANGMDSWQPYGPKFTYDATTETYSLDVYFTGLNVTAADEGYGYFSLSSVISNPNNPNWSDIPNSARYNAQYDDFPITGLAYNQSVTNNLYQTNPNYAYKIDPGVYTITVNKGKTEVTVTKHELTLSFNPPSGTTVAAGDPVNIYSNLEQAVHAINPDEPLHATFTYATSTDGSLPTPDTAGSTVNITAVGATTTVNAQAALGYIVVPGNADYIVPAPAVYSITTIVNPEGAGTITAPADAIVGTTVTFTVGTNEGYQLDQVQVTYGSNLAILDYTYDPETGVYSFVMPNDEVRIYADYTRQSHGITTVVNPEGAGTITVAADAFAGETVNFTVTTAEAGFTFESVTVVVDGTEQTVALTDNGDGSYSFVMPNEDVTITANFALKGEIFRLVTKNSEIVEGKTYIYVSQAHDQVMAHANAYEVCGNADIIEWVTPDKLKVKVDGRAAFFKPYLLVDSTLSSLELKVSYLKTLDGCYLGFDESSRQLKAYPAILSYGDNFRTLMNINFRDTHDITEQNYYYVYVRYRRSALSMFFNERFYFPAITPTMTYDNHVNLYKLAESYNIFSDCTPTGSGHLDYSGQVTGTTAIDGDTVIVTPVAALGYAFDDVTGITVTVNDTGETVEVTANEDGTYTFVMPIGDVTVSATFVTGYTITTICDPDAGGQFEGPIRASAYEGENVAFSVITNDNYMLESVTFVYEDSGIEEPGSNYAVSYPEIDNRVFGFEFEMPAENVTIIAHFVPAHHVTCVMLPSDDAGELYTGRENDFGYYVDSYFAYEENVLVDLYRYEGYVLDSVTVTRDDNGQAVTLSNPYYDEETLAHFWDFVMPDADVTVTAYLSLFTPLSFIERSGTFIKDGDEVTVADTLIGTWAAKQYLWAKDQAPYVSNFYLEKSEEENVHDYLREFYRLQYRDWDQSNWVMLDFSTIPELAGYTQQQLMDVMNDYVDNQIVAGSIKGTYKCEESDDVFRIYNDLVKVRHIIELSELPQYVKEPATIGPNNTLGYPGFQNDPQEKDGKYYAQPKSNYAYNHYTPANFLLENTVSDGLARVHLVDGYGEIDRGYRMFFMRPKDREVVQVWAVWLGEFDSYMDVVGEEFRPAGDEVFEVYRFNHEAGINTLDIHGAFRVGSWDYNINETDGAGKPIGYGKPQTPLRKDFDYTFHAAVEYSPVIEGPVSAPRRVNGEAETSTPEYYNVYPLDMTSPEETYTGVKEVVSRDATLIVDIRYYNIMGQESMTPFDGINIMVIRYKDGSFISKKILK